MICERRRAVREHIKDGSESCCAVWFEDGDTDRKRRGVAGRGRAKDAQIFFGRDQNGQD